MPNDTPQDPTDVAYNTGWTDFVHGLSAPTNDGSAVDAARLAGWKNAQAHYARHPRTTR